MTSFTYHFRPSVRQGRQRGSIFIRIIHDRKSFNLSTRHRIYPEEWDHFSRTVIVPHRSSARYSILRSVRDDMDLSAADFERMQLRLISCGNYTLDDIRTVFRSRQDSELFSSFVTKVASDISTKQPRTAKAYLSVLRSFGKFNHGRDIAMSRLSRRIIESYETYLKDEGLEMNTVSFYMRNLRALYNRAVNMDIIARPLDNPFCNVFTGIRTTEKKALDAGQIKKLTSLDPNLLNFRFKGSSGLKPPMRDSLAMFLFCFFAQGMSFVDMAYLKKSDITGGVIRYRRKKTGQTIELSVCSEMRSIIEYFSARTRKSEYVFPIITKGDKSERLQYESALRLQNIRLKKLGLMSVPAEKISTHAARHSWATIAKNEKVEVSVISEALGHNSESTTRIYLDSFKRKLLDKANERIRRAIKKAV